jgi:hypothetical protein
VNVLPLIRLTLCVFLMVFVLTIRASTQATTNNNAAVAQEIVEVRIADMNAAVREDRVTIADQGKRIGSLEQELAMIRGAVIGFGGLLSALQVIGLIKRRAA